jgi:hypothetical protein
MVFLDVSHRVDRTVSLWMHRGRWLGSFVDPQPKKAIFQVGSADSPPIRNFGSYHVGSNIDELENTKLLERGL